MKIIQISREFWSYYIIDEKGKIVKAGSLDHAPEFVITKEGKAVVVDWREKE